jgi:hypothetical protein
MRQPSLFDNSIPGSDLVLQGLGDLSQGRVTIHSLLLQVASPRLKNLRIEVPKLNGIPTPDVVPFEHQLYELLQDQGGYSMYNSLLRRMASFCAALERETKSP